MTIIEELAELTVKLENDETVTRQEAYNMFLRSLVEIRYLTNRISFLEGQQT